MSVFLVTIGSKMDIAFARGRHLFAMRRVTDSSSGIKPRSLKVNGRADLGVANALFVNIKASECEVDSETSSATSMWKTHKDR
jgi:hypothetical protein